MSLRGATLYFDCFAGIAGDMTLGALFDLGVPEEFVRQSLSRLPLGGYKLLVSSVRKGALLGRHIEVIEEEHEHAHDHEHEHTHEHEHDHSHAHDPLQAHEHGHPEQHRDPHHPHVHYAQIRAMIEGAREAGLDSDIIRRALDMFDRLAAVEAALHGVEITEVAFHEVGALDSIIDIVGVAAALSYLSPKRVVARQVALGSGTVKTAHGLLPVPAPATLALLKGAPVEAGGPACELTTPTGAVILAANVTSYGALPAMRILAVGHGAGTRELADRPNILRIVAGIEAEETASAAPNELVVIEANIDDMNPQLYGPLIDRLLTIGARDAWLTPVQMKKGRPGVVVSVLCDPPLREAAIEVILRESTTLGVRLHTVSRQVLERESVTVATEFGPIVVKLGRDARSGAVWNVAPEFSSCVEQARAHSAPLKTVMAAALAAYLHR